MSSIAGGLKSAGAAGMNAAKGAYADHKQEIHGAAMDMGRMGINHAAEMSGISQLQALNGLPAINGMPNVGNLTNFSAPNIGNVSIPSLNPDKLAFGDMFKQFDKDRSGYIDYNEF